MMNQRYFFLPPYPVFISAKGGGFLLEFDSKALPINLVYMKNDQLSQIGIRIKQFRLQKKITLRELARKSSLSPGLISKIENFRTVPSIAVLMEIALALEIDISELVKSLDSEPSGPHVWIKNGEGLLETREDSPQLIYRHLLTQNLSALTIRVNRVIIPAGSTREKLSTHAHELIYGITGSVTYCFDKDTVELKAGDTLYFNGREAHGVENPSNTTAELLKVYFITPDE